MQKSPSRKKKVVLFLASAPADLPRLGLEKEWRMVCEALRRSKFAPVKIDQATVKDWLDALREHRPQIIHFAGHGAGDKGILVCDDHGNSTELSNDQLEKLFKQKDVEVELVVLNACYTEVQANTLAEWVPKIVGMRQDAGDRSAQQFAAGLYRALGDGATVEKAFCDGAADAMLTSMNENDKERFRPVLLVDGKFMDYDSLCVKSKVSQTDGQDQKNQGRSAPRGNRMLIRKRQKETDRLFELYRGEPNKLELGQHLRIGYSHQFWFIPGLPGAVDLDSLTVTKRAEDYEVDRELSIKGFKEAAIRYRVSKGAERPYDGYCVRLCSWDERHTLTLARAVYSDQFVTNQKEIVDVNLGDIANASGVTWPVALSRHSLRDLNRLENGMLVPFDDSRLANTIGVASTLVTKEGKLLFPIRVDKHFQSGYDGCSISRVLKWTDALFEDFGRALANQLLDQMHPDGPLRGLSLVSIQPLALARELERAGKPQFFYHLWVEKDGADHINKVGGKWVSLFDYDLKANAPMAVAQAIERIMVMLHRDEVFTHDTAVKLVLAEEARAGLYYLMRYLDAKGVDAFPRSWLEA